MVHRFLYEWILGGDGINSFGGHKNNADPHQNNTSSCVHGNSQLPGWILAKIVQESIQQNILFVLGGDGANSFGGHQAHIFLAQKRKMAYLI